MHLPLPQSVTDPHNEIAHLPLGRDRKTDRKRRGSGSKNGGQVRFPRSTSPRLSFQAVLWRLRPGGFVVTAARSPVQRDVRFSRTSCTRIESGIVHIETILFHCREDAALRGVYRNGISAPIALGSRSLLCSRVQWSERQRPHRSTTSRHSEPRPGAATARSVSLAPAGPSGPIGSNDGGSRVCHISIEDVHMATRPESWACLHFEGLPKRAVVRTTAGQGS